MKIKTTMSVLLTTLAVNASAQTQTGNDTLIVEEPKKVTIIKSENGEKWTVVGKKGDPLYQYKRELQITPETGITESERSEPFNFSLPITKRTGAWTVETSGFYFGVSNDVAARDGVDVNMGSSWEIGINNLAAICYNPRKGKSTFSVGVGFGWKNYRMTGKERFEKIENQIQVTPYPAEVDPKFSRVKVFSWKLPVMYDYAFARKWHLKLGAIANFNTRSNIKTRYYVGDDKKKEMTKNIHTNSLGLELFGQLSYNGIGVYAKYSPTPVFDKRFGPQFRSFSIGIVLW